MGTIVTRYRIEDEVGRVLTNEYFFSYEVDDALQFRCEDEALEEAAAFPGTTVERFERYSTFPDFFASGRGSTERNAA
ncbi:hypothetical protein [Sinorhizobium meliloti]|uniref:hypothetical protein n=1 Tax=Rhizobium meliloti TaxID=382 RepID=UPI000B4988E6|nr:hypothetical protein [Sinorhizobium meliloti]ASP63365.1 hypothetical protein CDO29_01325 [Sinorhizobium meliloti]MQX04130.1 hypothetical protein [Sinorhizobium meliloti]RVK43875.1 hypothetical protein CN160_28155 [Sinorhizobium meliloti]RVQ31242.1 hypothetical protein CN068_29285 [Sinorhizobium meliloti]